MSLYFRTFIMCAALLIPAISGATEIIISGKIVDTSGNPIPGVRFTVPGRRALPHPLEGQMSLLFPGVPAACMQVSLSGLQTNAQGDYRLRVNFNADQPIPGDLQRKTCADYLKRINRANMKLVPRPADVQRYDLVIAHGPLPQHARGGNVREQIQPARHPAPRGGFAPRR